MGIVISIECESWELGTHSQSSLFLRSGCTEIPIFAANIYTGESILRDSSSRIPFPSFRSRDLAISDNPSLYW
jgi:hypothetical protein